MSFRRPQKHYGYPLDITMENQLFQWPCSSSQTVKFPEGIPWKIRTSKPIFFHHFLSHWNGHLSNINRGWDWCPTSLLRDLFHITKTAISVWIFYPPRVGWCETLGHRNSPLIDGTIFARSTILRGPRLGKMLLLQRHSFTAHRLRPRVLVLPASRGGSHSHGTPRMAVCSGKAEQKMDDDWVPPFQDISMYVCMHECMNQWMNEWMYVWMNVCMYVWMNVCMYE